MEVAHKLNEAEITEKDSLLLKLKEADSLLVKLKEVDSLLVKLKEADSLLVKLKEADSLLVKLKEADSLLVKLKEADSLLVKLKEADSLLVKLKEADSLLVLVKLKLKEADSLLVSTQSEEDAYKVDSVDEEQAAEDATRLDDRSYSSNNSQPLPPPNADDTQDLAEDEQQNMDEEQAAEDATRLDNRSYSSNNSQPLPPPNADDTQNLAEDEQQNMDEEQAAEDATRLDDDDTQDPGDEQQNQMYMWALFHTLTESFISVEKLHRKLDGKLDKITVRKLIDKMIEEGFVEDKKAISNSKGNARKVIHSDLTEMKLSEVKVALNMHAMVIRDILEIPGMPSDPPEEVEFCPTCSASIQSLGLDYLQFIEHKGRCKRENEKAKNKNKVFDCVRI